ncbi:MAG TPA: riboflavin biosynthesis protein RibF [Bacilli bacterium]|jgi:riboflavin kinase/FMN adenylyltransferase|nr:riboflavin biosynthesis protein RibF [Bacilli bacterium]
MKIISLDLKNIEPLTKDTALCLGTFDGVHLGHQKLIEKAKELTKNIAVMLIIPPISMKAIETNNYPLTSLTDRKNIFKNLGVKTLIIATLNDKFKELEPKEFINQVLNKLKPHYVIVGEDYHFGKKALGDVKTLLDASKDFELYAVSHVLTKNGLKVSTTLIRELLKKGDLEEATILLSRPYEVKGFVIKGHGLGKKLGYPTANIELLFSYQLPKDGVYFVEIILNNIKCYGMANIGLRPSVNPLITPLLEVHIFDFKEDIYKEELSIRFLKYIREETKQESMGKLIKQLQKDEEVCRKLIKEMR